MVYLQIHSKQEQKCLSPAAAANVYVKIWGEADRWNDERDPTIWRVSSIVLPCTATNQPSRGTNFHFFPNLARAAVVDDD